MKKHLLSAQLIICLGFVCCIPQMLLGQLPNYVPTNGLVGYWPFNGNANDESGNGNNGTVNGATLTTDRFGVANKAYSFDGVDDYITIPRNTVFTDEISISGWIYCSSVSGKRDIVTNWQSPPSQRLINLYIENGLLITSIQPSSQVYATSNFLSIGEWKFVCSTFDGQNVKVYVDGQLSVTTASPSSNLAINQRPNWFVGAAEDNASIIEFFLGKIDDIGIWNRALTQQEITNLYNSQTLPTCSVTATNNTICAGSNVSLNVVSNTQNLEDTIVKPGNNSTPIIGSAFEYSYTTPSAGWTTNYGGWSLGNLPYVGVNTGAVPNSTFWPLGTTIYLRKQIDLSFFDLSTINWKIAVDNGYSLYINGNLVGSANQGGPAIEWEYSGTFNQNLLVPGINTIALVLTDDGAGAAVFNMMVTGTPYSSNYLWSNGATTPSITVSPTQTTTYTCTVTANGQSCQASQTIEVIPAPTITATNTAICAGGSTTLTASGATPSACPTLNGSLTTGLVGYWPFCGNANDASGNGNNGIVNGATLTTDRFGNANSAYSFDGVDDFIQCVQAGPTGNPTMTCSFWIRTNSTNYGHIIGYGGNSESGRDFRVYINGGCPGSIDFDTYDNLSSKSSSHSNTWDFYTIVYNGSIGNNTLAASIYKNGILLSNTCFNVNISITNISNSIPIFFGKYHGTLVGNSPAFLSGKLDDIAIYNRALSASEIQQLYNQGQTTYSWSNGTTTPSITVSPTQTTTYTCTVTTNGTSCSSDFTVTVNPLPPVNAGNDQTVCAGTAVTLSGTGANTYSWNNSVSNGVAFTPASTATYTVTGTNTATGCTNTDQVVVNVNALPTVNAGNDQTVCAGTAVTLSGTGATSYSWNNSVSNGVAFTPALTTTYTVTGTNTATGCTNTDQVVVNVNALPTVNAGNDQTVCAGTAVTLSGTGATSYAWNNSVSNGVSFTPAATGTYTVTGTNTATSCTNTDQVVVNVNALPTVNAGNDQTVCSGTAVTLSGTGATSYSWNNSVSNGVAFTPASTATYTVTGTNTATGCTNTDQVVVNVNALPTVYGGPDQTLCQGQSTSLFATGASTYVWSNNVSNGVGFLPTATQVYTVTGTNSSTGCTNVDTVVVTVNALPTVSAGVDQTVCKGDSIDLSGSGALSYQWDNNVSDGVLFAPQTTQTYVVTGTDANGCVDTDDVTVTVNQPSFSTLTETALDSYTLNGQTYTQSGTYTQVVSNAAGCDSTITLNLTLNFTGIEELTHSVVLSPNPTFGSLTISSVDAINENFILFDAQGRKLVTGTLKGTATTIDLTSLARGNYLLMIGEKSVYKVVKE